MPNCFLWFHWYLIVTYDISIFVPNYPVGYSLHSLIEKEIHYMLNILKFLDSWYLTYIGIWRIYLCKTTGVPNMPVGRHENMGIWMVSFLISLIFSIDKLVKATNFIGWILWFVRVHLTVVYGVCIKFF